MTNLGSGNSTIVVITWNIASNQTTCQNWTIRAEAPLVGDANPYDNNLTDGTVKITILGDVNGDGTINLLDLVKTAAAFGAIPGSWAWNPLTDIWPDNYINIYDLVAISLRFGQHCPP